MSAERDMQAFGKVRAALERITESSIDTGSTAGGRDFWLRINGAEYYITVQRSAHQEDIDQDVAKKLKRET